MLLALFRLVGSETPEWGNQISADLIVIFPHCAFGVVAAQEEAQVDYASSQHLFKLTAPGRGLVGAKFEIKTVRIAQLYNVVLARVFPVQLHGVVAVCVLSGEFSVVDRIAPIPVADRMHAVQQPEVTVAFGHALDVFAGDNARELNVLVAVHKRAGF